jgi:hypothetical protein
VSGHDFSRAEPVLANSPAHRSSFTLLALSLEGSGFRAGPLPLDRTVNTPSALGLPRSPCSAALQGGILP